MQLNRKTVIGASAALCMAFGLGTLIRWTSSAPHQDDATVHTENGHVQATDVTPFAPAEDIHHDILLRHRTAQEVVPTIRAVCGDRMKQLTVDQVTNTISITASPKVTDEVQRLVTLLDQPDPEALSNTRVVRLRNADPKQVQIAMNRLFGTGKQTVAQPTR